jgi:hypothetical protein
MQYYQNFVSSDGDNKAVLGAWAQIFLIGLVKTLNCRSRVTGRNLDGDMNF